MGNEKSLEQPSIAQSSGMEPSEGPDMAIEVFIITYGLGEDVSGSLQAAGIESPVEINHLSYDDYLASMEGGKGLGMRMGPARRLQRAMTAWRLGNDLQEIPIRSSATHTEPQDDAESTEHQAQGVDDDLYA